MGPFGTAGWAAALGFLLLQASSRTLPDKNELANACYFTYRVGYVICDSGLSPEEAQEQMKEGKCNEDFRLMGSDFQRRIVRHYYQGERPPLEEAMWLITAPENFQLRTLAECSAMQIIAYLLVAESKLPLQGTQAGGPASELANLAVQQAHQVPAEVYASLTKAWPLELAIQRYQAIASGLRSLMASRDGGEEKPFLVHVVVCRCAEDLDWLPKVFWPSRDATIFVYETCPGQVPQVLGEGFRAMFAPPDAADSHGECGARVVLEHATMTAAAGEAEAPAFLLFLSATGPPPGGDDESRLRELVARTLELRSLDVAFVPLGSRRSAPRQPLACQRAFWQAALLSEGGWPRGYEGAQFLVSGQRVRSRPAQYYQELLAILDAPLAACGAPEDLRGVLSGAWHAVFGEPRLQPPRADDPRLPLFLRASGSGFSGSRLPQFSIYLDSKASLPAGAEAEAGGVGRSA